MSRWTPSFDALWGSLRERAGATSAVPVLWLGPQGAVPIATGRAHPAPGSAPAGAGAADAAATACADFAAWCTAHPGQACRVLLSSEWLAVITTDPALGLRQADELQAHARTQFEQYHGSPARDWPLRVWHSAAGSGATAVQGGVLARLQGVAAAHGVRLLSVQAAWTVVAAQWAPATPALLLLAEGSLVTAVATAQGRTRCVALRRCPADPAQKALWEAALRTEWALGEGCPSLWIEGPLGAGQQPQLAVWRPAADDDFLASAQPRRLPVLAAAAAVCIAVAAALDTHAAWQTAQDAQQALQNASQEPPVPAPPPPSTASAAPDASAAEAALLATLRQPWPAVFAASEAATRGQMHWLLFDHDGRTLRLEATAPDLPAAWQAAAGLGQQPGVVQAVVAHLQADGPTVRFELRADWAAAVPPAARRDAPR